MYIDMDGVKRLKINLHAHTTDSDGRVSPEEAARIYREACWRLAIPGAGTKAES